MKEPENSGSISIRVPARLKYLSLICAFVESFCKALVSDMPDSDVRALQLALDEVCSNVIRHGYGGECDSTLSIEAQYEERSLCFVITDQGKRFDIDKAEAPPIPPPRESGYGIAIIRRAVDEVEHTWDGQNNITRLTKYIRRTNDVAPTSGDKPDAGA